VKRSGIPLELDIWYDSALVLAQMLQPRFNQKVLAHAPGRSLS
jgi:hypothetical protein